MNEINNASINRLATIAEGRELLLVGLKKDYIEKPQHVKALRNEWTRHHELDHPNIIKYVDQREVDGFGAAIAMEWEPARTLTEYMAEEHSDEEKKSIVRQVANAVAYLHQQQLVHGAISPATIFVTRQGDRAKLLCFRLRFADSLYEPRPLAQYHAPEAKDGTVTLDARSDIYSLGILVRDLGLSGGYDDLIKTATQTARATRFADVDSFLDALDHHRTARRTAPAKSSAPTAGGSKRVAIVIAAIIGLAVIAAIMFWNHQSTDETEVAAANTEVAGDNESATDNADATQTTADATATPDNATPASTPAPSPRNDNKYSGELIFLNDLVPQMRIDLDKIYAKAQSPQEARRRVQTYYKGLRRAISPKSDAQMAAFDKEFALYVNQKNQK